MALTDAHDLATALLKHRNGYDTDVSASIAQALQEYESSMFERARENMGKSAAGLQGHFSAHGIDERLRKSKRRQKMMEEHARQTKPTEQAGSGVRLSEGQKFRSRTISSGHSGTSLVGCHDSQSLFSLFRRTALRSLAMKGLRMTTTFLASCQTCIMLYQYRLGATNSNILQKSADMCTMSHNLVVRGADY